MTERQATQGGRGEKTVSPARRGPTLSVTVVNHSSRDLLRQCLISLRAHPYTVGPTEIVIVDNASRDGSVEMLASEFPEVTVLAEQTRRGFGANQNRAVAASHGELIFMLNPDCMVRDGTLDRLVSAFEWDPRVAASGGPVINEDGTYRQNGLNAFHTPLGIYARALGLGRLLGNKPMKTGLTVAGWPSGGSCVLRRQVFDELGGFDERYFMYSEDADLFALLVERRYLLAWVGGAVVTHPFPSEPTPMSSRREAEKIRSELLYMRKHFGSWGEGGYRAGIILDAALRVAVLSTPGLKRLVQRHGKTVAETRSRHMVRLRHALGAGGPGLAELAAEWNLLHGSALPEQK